MDQLTKDAIMARRKGMSYGRYMALKEQKPPPVRYPKKKPAAEKKCVICGQPIIRCIISFFCIPIGAEVPISINSASAKISSFDFVVILQDKEQRPYFSFILTLRKLLIRMNPTDLHTSRSPPGSIAGGISISKCLLFRRDRFFFYTSHGLPSFHFCPARSTTIIPDPINSLITVASGRGTHFVLKYRSPFSSSR